MSGPDGRVWRVGVRTLAVLWLAVAECAAQDCSSALGDASAHFGGRLLATSCVACVESGCHYCVADGGCKSDATACASGSAASDTAQCATNECSPQCSVAQLGDGACNVRCLSAACFYDLDDCYDAYFNSEDLYYSDFDCARLEYASDEPCELELASARAQSLHSRAYVVHHVFGFDYELTIQAVPDPDTCQTCVVEMPVSANVVGDGAINGGAPCGELRAAGACVNASAECAAVFAAASQPVYRGYSYENRTAYSSASEALNPDQVDLSRPHWFNAELCVYEQCAPDYGGGPGQGACTPGVLDDCSGFCMPSECLNATCVAMNDYEVCYTRIGDNWRCANNVRVPNAGFARDGRPCPFAAACVGGDAACARGHTGAVCEHCEAGYFVVPGEGCVACPEAYPTWLTPVLYLAALLIVCGCCCSLSMCCVPRWQRPAVMEAMNERPRQLRALKCLCTGYRLSCGFAFFASEHEASEVAQVASDAHSATKESATAVATTTGVEHRGSGRGSASGASASSVLFSLRALVGMCVTFTQYIVLFTLKFDFGLPRVMFNVFQVFAIVVGDIGLRPECEGVDSYRFHLWRLFAFEIAFPLLVLLGGAAWKAWRRNFNLLRFYFTVYTFSLFLLAVHFTPCQVGVCEPALSEEQVDDMNQYYSVIGIAGAVLYFVVVPFAVLAATVLHRCRRKLSLAFLREGFAAERRLCCCSPQLYWLFVELLVKISSAMLLMIARGFLSGEDLGMFSWVYLTGLHSVHLLLLATLRPYASRAINAFNVYAKALLVLVLGLAFAANHRRLLAQSSAELSAARTADDDNQAVQLLFAWVTLISLPALFIPVLIYIITQQRGALRTAWREYLQSVTKRRARNSTAALSARNSRANLTAMQQQQQQQQQQQPLRRHDSWRASSTMRRSLASSVTSSAAVGGKSRSRKQTSTHVPSLESPLSTDDAQRKRFSRSYGRSYSRKNMHFEDSPAGVQRHAPPAATAALATTSSAMSSAAAAAAGDAHTCRECGAHFDTSAEVRAHCADAHNLPHACTLCDNCYGDAQSLAYHQSIRH